MEISSLGNQGTAVNSLETASEAPVRVSCVPVTPSKRIVAGMMALNEQIRDRGFRAAMRALFPDSEVGDCSRFIPDAFHVSHEKEIVTLIEVDDTNPIDEVKAAKIADFTMAVQDCLWDVDVVVIDYAGNVKAAVPGIAYWSFYSGELTPFGCRDLTPAARAAARSLSLPLTESHTSADDLADRL